MHIGVVTLFPPMFEAVTGYGVSGRAVKEGRLCVDLWNPRDFTRGRHRTVDDRPYGGGPGMVMLYDPLVAAIQAPIIMMSQNRQAAKDRLQASHDYEVNLKAEIEIMALHEKMDELRQKDLQALIECMTSKS